MFGTPDGVSKMTLLFARAYTQNNVRIRVYGKQDVKTAVDIEKTIFAQILIMGDVPKTSRVIETREMIDKKSHPYLFGKCGRGLKSVGSPFFACSLM